MRQGWAACYGGVIGQVATCRQHGSAHSVYPGRLVQNVDLDGVCANGAAVDCSVGASTCFGVECLEQLLRGNVGVLYFHQPQYVSVQAQNGFNNFCLLAFKFSQGVSTPAVAGSYRAAAQCAALAGLACSVLAVGKCCEIVQHIQAGDFQGAANIWCSGFAWVGIHKQRRSSRVNAVAGKAMAEHPRYFLRGVAHAAHAGRARCAEVRRRVWVLCAGAVIQNNSVQTVLGIGYHHIAVVGVKLPSA